MELRKLSDSDLLKNTQQLAQKERETTLEVLRHLREVERRSLFATLAYPSLFEYAVKELKYSASAAQRRIMSMRLLKEVPSLEKKIEEGALNLSTLAQAQSFFRQEKLSESAQVKNTADKIELLKSLENKSTREVERVLVSRSSEPQKLIPEKLRAVSDTHTEVKFLVEEELLKEIEELRALLSNKLPGASVKEVLAYAVKTTVKNLKPKEPKLALVEQEKKSSQGISYKSSRELEQRAALPAPWLVPTQKVTQSHALVPAPVLAPAQKVAAANASRCISVEIKRAVWKRDRGCCTYVYKGKRCDSKHALEFDHIQPFALGGKSSVENLRLRCRAHNQLAALQSFGQIKMATYVARMK